MALSLPSSLSLSVPVGVSSTASLSTPRRSLSGGSRSPSLTAIKLSRNINRQTRFVVAAADGADVATVKKMTEVTVDTFYPALEAAGDKLVVLDMYTQWCGPCKMLEPKIQALVPEYTDVVFLKLDCNQANKSLAKELGVRVVPTFKLFRNKEKVGEIVGAKFDLLLAEINKWRVSE